MACATDGLQKIDLDNYIAPLLYSRDNPALGAELTKFLYLQDKAQANLADEIRQDPSKILQWPLIKVNRSLSTTLTAGSSGSLEFNPNGGMNAIVLSVNAYAYSGFAAVDTGLIDYKDVDANRFEWIESTSLYNVHGTGQLPGALFPLRYVGNSRHTITLTNNFSASVTIKLSYTCLIIGRLGAH